MEITRHYLEEKRQELHMHLNEAYRSMTLADSVYKDELRLRVSFISGEIELLDNLIEEANK